MARPGPRRALTVTPGIPRAKMFIATKARHASAGLPPLEHAPGYDTLDPPRHPPARCSTRWQTKFLDRAAALNAAEAANLEEQRSASLETLTRARTSPNSSRNQMQLEGRWEAAGRSLGSPGRRATSGRVRRGAVRRPGQPRATRPLARRAAAARSLRRSRPSSRTGATPNLPRDSWLEAGRRQAILDAAPGSWKAAATGLVERQRRHRHGPPVERLRVLQAAGRLAPRSGMLSTTGPGLSRTLSHHEHGHVDVSSIHVAGTFFSLGGLLNDRASSS